MSEAAAIAVHGANLSPNVVHYHQFAMDVDLLALMVWVLVPQVIYVETALSNCVKAVYHNSLTAVEWCEEYAGRLGNHHDDAQPRASN